MATTIPAVIDTHNVTSPKGNLTAQVDGTLTPDSSDDKHILDDTEASIPSIRDGLGTASSSETDLVNKWYEPPDTWESKHRWDPKATWTEAEESRLRRKLDYKVCLVACICFACLCLDRSNIGNALSDNMLKDVGLTTYHYNIGMTLFYVCFLVAELPSQLISKKLGSDVWIPIQMMGWSAVAIAQMGINSLGSFYATRALLGLIEGGFIADTILYLSYYYTTNELTIRLAWFWVSLTVTNVFGNLLAAGLLQMRGVHGLEGWRWLFCIEGILTFLIGAWALYYLPAGPTQTKNRFRKNGWFTEREEIIIVNKVIRDDPTKSSMHNREGLNADDLWRSLTDYDLWPLYIIGLTLFIAPQTIGAYFTLSLRNLGYSTFETNMLSIPKEILFIAQNLLLAFSTTRFNERVLLSSLAGWWILIFLVVLITIPDSTGKWAKWAILSLVQAFPYPHPILVSLNSANAGSVRTRTVASSIYNMAVQGASLIASNVYQPGDAPFYHRGNKVLVGIVVGNLVLFGFTKAWYIYRNKSRARIWDSWTLAERDEYIRTTKDQGNKRFTH